VAGGIDRYRRELHYQVRGLWSGAFDRDQFETNMTVLINDGLAAAFAEGAQSVGIQEDEFTKDEQRVINEKADAEVDQVAGFADAIIAGSRANGGKLEALYTRTEMWVLRYAELVSMGKAMAGADQKLKWVLGETEHCATCQRLSGLVHRGSQWLNYVMPQDHDLLCCGGWRCQCKLEPTTDKASRKYPPVPGDCKV